MEGNGRYGGYSDGSGRRDEVINFSLGLRHMPDRNPEQLKVNVILNLKVGDRRSIRVLVYENDNIQELGHRLTCYLAQYQFMYLPSEYQEHLT